MYLPFLKHIMTAPVKQNIVQTALMTVSSLLPICRRKMTGVEDQPYGTFNTYGNFGRIPRTPRGTARNRSF